MMSWTSWNEHIIHQEQKNNINLTHKKTEMETFNELIHSGKPVLVDFYATWCGPCKAMHPILESLKAEIGDAARIVKIDVDQKQSLAMQYGIQSVPTFIIFKNGQPVWRHSGMINGAELKLRLTD